MIRTAAEVIRDYRQGRSGHDPFDELGVLVGEIARLNDQYGRLWRMTLGTIPPGQDGRVVTPDDLDEMRRKWTAVGEPHNGEEQR